MCGRARGSRPHGAEWVSHPSVGAPNPQYGGVDGGFAAEEIGQTGAQFGTRPPRDETRLRSGPGAAPVRVAGHGPRAAPDPRSTHPGPGPAARDLQGAGGDQHHRLGGTRPPPRGRWRPGSRPAASPMPTCRSSSRPARRRKATWSRGSRAPARGSRCSCSPISTWSRRSARTGSAIPSSWSRRTATSTRAARWTTRPWPRSSWPT